MSTRRLFLRCAVVLPAGGLAPVQAAQRASLFDPLRLGVDEALAGSGLAARLQRGFGVDTGVAVQLVPEPASAVLEALERGERDAALTNAPAPELRLVDQGLAHARRAVAGTDFLLVGPMALATPLAAPHDIAVALSRLAQAKASFISAGDGSGTHLAEQALWRAARVAPAPPWYEQAPVPLQAARERQACTLVERGVWLRHRPEAGFGVLVDGDARLACELHVMQSFRTHHPGAALFEAWITGRAGRRAIGSVAGYRVLNAKAGP